jgi:8-oxo-dGTP diphosphatase
MFRVFYMKCIILTVDGIILYNGKIVLIRRKNEPFKGKLALPGGIVEYGESVENALTRELREETGLICKPKRLVGVYSRPDRDPRGHFVSVCFLAEPVGGKLKAGDDASSVILLSIEEALKCELAFDHSEMLREAMHSGVLSEM